MTYSRYTDEELIRFVAEGDDGAFTELRARHIKLFSVCAGKVLGFRSSEIEDVVQIGLLRIWKCADRFDPEIASFRKWATTIISRVAIDVRRRRDRGRDCLLTWTDAEFTDDRPHSNFVVVPTPDEIKLSDLDLSGLRVELLRVGELAARGVSYVGMVSLERIPLGTVKSRLNRFRKLAATLNPDAA